MPADVKIREFLFPDDYEASVALWANMEKGVHVGASDAPEEIQKKLDRDPDLFLVAEMDGRIIGTVIGGFDGRRGMIYHLAVYREFRGTGVGSRLMAEVEERLRGKGCLKCYLLTMADNLEAGLFYEHLGWYEMTDNRLFGKEFK
ncbi:MAG: GNAT family N-acetyltransferase [Chloroflexi bacterium]|nr:GNAT family N-acetyltransferase [Chloroflexota bacterium]